MAVIRSILSCLAVAAVFLLFPALSNAQIERCPYIENPAHREPLSKQVKERMIELCIEDTKKNNAFLQKHVQMRKR